MLTNPGFCGIIYLSKDDVQQNGIENPIKILKDEIKEYDDYLQGNIFGIIVLVFGRRVKCNSYSAAKINQ